MNILDRREFLRAAAAGGLFTTTLSARESTPTPTPSDLDQRICGLLIGSAVGDALGGPIEFQDPVAIQRLPDPPHHWESDERIDAAARSATATRLRLRPYQTLRPVPESYGQWNVNSPAGTITDDTRHKLVLLHALREAERRGAWPFGGREMARAFLDWPSTTAVTAHPEYAVLAADWLEEWQLSARWVLGERDLARARPPERMWQGLPTCCGQMTSLPLAALFAGRPEEAYRAAWHLGFFDNGWGKDLNAALVAGVSVALVTPVDPRSPATAWQAIFSAIRSTDPFGYARIRWSQRAVDRWMDFAQKSARDAAGHPARMFAVWDVAFQETTKWEAQVPFVVALGSIVMAEYDPLCGLQLTQEWGWDTDSYCQLLAAFVGALYGPGIFQSDWISAVKTRLRADHGVDLDQECALLSRLQRLAQRQALVEPS